MRKFSLSAVALVLMGGTAFAADLPVKAPAAYIAPVPVFTWQGFYIGANAGYGWGSSDFDNGFDLGGQDGAIVGGQIGYNWQWDNVVFGIEADLQYADLNTGYDFVGGGSLNSSMDYFGTVRARLGYAFDMFLPYVTGGLAYGKNEIDFNYLAGGGSDSNTHVGYTVGAGAEYAFSPNWSAKVEYLWTDLGSEEYLGRDVDVSFSTVRAGINYRF